MDDSEDQGIDEGEDDEIDDDNDDIEVSRLHIIYYCQT